MTHNRPNVPPSGVQWFADGLGAGEMIDHLVPKDKANGYRTMMAEIVAAFCKGQSLEESYQEIRKEFEGDLAIKSSYLYGNVSCIPEFLFARIRSGLVALLHLRILQDPGIPKRDLLLALLEEELQKTYT